MCKFNINCYKYFQLFIFITSSFHGLLISDNSLCLFINVYRCSYNILWSIYSQHFMIASLCMFNLLSCYLVDCLCLIFIVNLFTDDFKCIHKVSWRAYTWHSILAFYVCLPLFLHGFMEKLYMTSTVVLFLKSSYFSTRYQE